MAVKIIARAQITLAQSIDISASYWYYKLFPSAGQIPTKANLSMPTGATPGTIPVDNIPVAAGETYTPWSETQPLLNLEENTFTLYVVQVTWYTDNTYSFSEISQVSNYDAAVQAYSSAEIANMLGETNNSDIRDILLQLLGTNIRYRYTDTSTTPPTVKLVEKIDNVYYIEGTTTEISEEDLDKDGDDLVVIYPDNFRTILQQLTGITDLLSSQVDENTSKLNTTTDTVDELKEKLTDVDDQLSQIDTNNQETASKLIRLDTLINSNNNDLIAQLNTLNSNLGTYEDNVNLILKSINASLKDYDGFINITQDPWLELGKKDDNGNIQSMVRITGSEVQLRSEEKLAALIAAQLFTAPTFMTVNLIHENTNFRWIGRINGHLSLKTVIAQEGEN